MLGSEKRKGSRFSIKPFFIDQDTLAVNLRSLRKSDKAKEQVKQALALARGESEKHR